MSLNGMGTEAGVDVPADVAACTAIAVPNPVTLSASTPNPTVLARSRVLKLLYLACNRRGLKGRWCASDGFMSSSCVSKPHPTSAVGFAACGCG
jgi:hypothetical protein